MLLEKIHLESDEHILKQVRKHWFVLFIRLFSVALLALLPIIMWVVILLIPVLREVYGQLPLRNSFLLYLYVVLLLMLWMTTANICTNYYLDVWTITNKRLIAVNQRGLFNRTVGSFRLERLQDMNTEVNGIIATLLNFGRLQAQTAAGSEEEFRADGLPNPRELKAIILRAADEMMGTDRSSRLSDGT